MTAARCAPSAITPAPVRVATSSTTAGLKRRAYWSASQRISRPSASVLTTSIVRPDMLRTMSPGLVACPLGMFSQAGTLPARVGGSPMIAAALIAPKTLAAPVMSNFISSMPGGCLRDMPPLSEVTPLPPGHLGRGATPLAAHADRHRAAAPALVAQYDQPPRLVVSCRHRQERTHSQALQLPFVERAGADGSMLARKLPRARGGVGGGAGGGGGGGGRADARAQAAGGARRDSWACRRWRAGWRGRA